MGDEVGTNVLVKVGVIVLVPVGVIVGKRTVTAGVNDGVEVKALVTIDVEALEKKRAPCNLLVDIISKQKHNRGNQRAKIFYI